MFDSGNVPLRAKGVSRDVPTTGTDRFDWRGYDPASGLAAYEPFNRRPQAVNEPFFTNWNNGVSRGYYSSDREFGYGPVHRSRTLTERVRSRIKGRRKITAAGLIDAMEDAGTVDVRGNFVARWLARMIGTRTNDETVNQAVVKLRAWARDGGHRRDFNRDGAYEHSEAVKIMDAWWPRLIPAIYRPVLGNPMYERLSTFFKIEDTPNDNGNRTNSHATRGWYSYVHKDMRTLLGKKVKGRYSRTYPPAAPRAPGAAPACGAAVRFW